MPAFKPALQALVPKMIDLDLVKVHLKVDGDDEDTLIQGYTDAAISSFELWTNRSLVAEGDPLPDPVGNALTITKAIRQERFC